MNTSYFQVGGNVSEDAECYVERPADSELLDALGRDEICLILAPRQTGKSSLMVHALKALRERGVSPAIVDLQPLGSVQDLEQWFSDVLEQIQHSMKLNIDCLDWWEKHKRITSTQRFMRFLEDVVLADGRCVLFFDEIETLFNLPFSDDFFTTLRAFYNDRATNPKLKQLSFVLLGMASASELIRDYRRTPFNIGTSIALSDFDQAKTEGFGKVFGDTDGLLIQRIFHWTQGQPFLVQTLASVLYKFPSKQRSVEMVDGEVGRLFFAHTMDNKNPSLEGEAHLAHGHLKYIRDYLLEPRPGLHKMLKLYRRVLAGKEILHDPRSPEQNRLLLAGVVRVAGQTLTPRNPIYAKVFNDAWAKANTPKILAHRLVLGILAVLVPFLLWKHLLYPLLFSPRFPQETRIPLYTAAPELSLMLQDTNVARISLKSDDGGSEQTLFEAKPWLGVFVPAQHTQLSWPIDDLPVGEHQYTLHLTAGWPKAQTQDIKLEVAYYPNWEVKQFPDQRLLELNPVLELIDKKIVFHDATNRRELGQMESFSGSKITVTALSTDRSYLLIGTDKGVVEVWKLVIDDSVSMLNRSVKANHLKDLRADMQGITVLALTADGKMAVSGSHDRGLRKWNIETEENQIANLVDNDDALAITISGDNRHIYTAGEDGKLQVMGEDNPRRILTHLRPITALALSGDGKKIFFGDKEGMLWIKDTTTDDPPEKEWQGHKGPVTQVAWSEDGQRFLSGGEDGKLAWWDKDGHNLGAVHAEKAIRQAGWLVHGACIYSIDEDHSLAVWQTVDAANIPVYAGHQGFIAPHSLTFSPDQQLIASGGSDNTTKVWDLKNGKILNSFPHDGQGQGQGQVWGLEFLSDNKTLLIGENGKKSIQLWDFYSDKVIYTFTGHTISIEDISVSDKGQLAASASGDNSVKVWDVTRDQVLYTLEKAHSGKVYAVAFSPDGKILASGGGDNRIALWNTADRTLIRSINTESTVNSIAFSPKDGISLVTAQNDNTLKLWETASGKLQRSFEGHKDFVRDVAFSPDGNTLASASNDGTVKLWDTDSGNVLRNYTGHKGAALAVAFSPDGRWISSGGVDGIVRLWWAKVR